MRWLILWLCLCPWVSGAEVVRLVTWNLEWFPGRKPTSTPEEREKHFQEVAAVIPGFHADILVLEEVRDEETMQRLVKVLPGFHVDVVSQFKDEFTKTVGIQQIAILSRFKADGAWAESWKRGWAKAPRGYAYARLMISGKPLHVYGLHLKSNLRGEETNTSKREDAMEQLLAHSESQVKEAEPVVVAGDFNTSKDQANLLSDTTLTKIEAAGFFWAFTGIPLEHRITIPGKGKYPDACFDHIYVRNLGRPASMVLPDTPGSDHFPVVVDLVVGE